MGAMNEIETSLRRSEWDIVREPDGSLTAYKGDWWLFVSRQEPGVRLGGFISPDWSAASLFCNDDEYPRQFYWHGCDSGGRRAGLQELLEAIAAIAKPVQ